MLLCYNQLWHLFQLAHQLTDLAQISSVKLWEKNIPVKWCRRVVIVFFCHADFSCVFWSPTMSSSSSLFRCVSTNFTICWIVDSMVYVCVHCTIDAIYQPYIWIFINVFKHLKTSVASQHDTWEFGIHRHSR